MIVLLEKANKNILLQLLKRFNHDWKKLEEEIKGVDAVKTYRAISRVKNRYGGAPDEQDLQGAAKALNRLQAVYRLIFIVTLIYNLGNKKFIFLAVMTTI